MPTLTHPASANDVARFMAAAPELWAALLAVKQFGKEGWGEGEKVFYFPGYLMPTIDEALASVLPKP